MNIHKNVRLTPKGREILVCRIVNEGLRVEEAAQASGVSVRTAYKWLAGIGHRDEEVSGTVLRVRSAARIAPRRHNGRRFWPCAAPGAPIARLAEEPGWRTARWAGSPSRGD